LADKNVPQATRLPRLEACAQRSSAAAYSLDSKQSFKLRPKNRSAGQASRLRYFFRIARLPLTPFFLSWLRLTYELRDIFKGEGSGSFGG